MASDYRRLGKGLQLETNTSPSSNPGSITFDDTGEGTLKISSTTFSSAIILNNQNTVAISNKTISLGSNTLTGTSAQLAAAISDETGSGSLVFATSPSLTTPTFSGNTNVSTGRLYVNGNGEVFNLGVRYNTGAGYYYLGSSNAANSDLIFSNDAGSEKMRLKYSGNLGIGTDNPSSRLHISNNTASQAAITGTGIHYTGADSTATIALIDGHSAPPTIHGRRSGGTAASPTAIQNDQGLLLLGGYAYGSTGYSSGDRVRITYLSNENWTDSAQGTKIAFYTTTNGTTTTSNKMLLTDTGQLRVLNTGGVSGKILATATDSAWNSIAAYSNPSSTHGIEMGANATLGYVGVNSVGTHDFLLMVQGSPKVIIQNNGNVGIGTTPSSKLHVGGVGASILTINSSTTATDSSIELGTGGTGDRNAIIDLTGDDSFPDYGLRIFRLAGANNGATIESRGLGNFFIKTIEAAQIIFTTSSFSRMAIGSDGHPYPATTNTYDMGKSGASWRNIYSQNAVTVTSDRREKNTITTSDLGLDFINALNPVSYKWNVGQNNVSKDENGEDVITPIPGVRTHYGLIAQEVKDVLSTFDKDGTSFAGWHLMDKNDPNSQQALGYGEFMAPMIKAIQELSAQNAALLARIEALENA
jgi:hypothetical protein